MAILDTQVVVEILADLPPPTEVNQIAVEALADTSPTLTCGQIVAELLLDPGPTNLDLNQIVIELLTNPPPSGSGVQIQPKTYYFLDRDTPLDRLVAPYRSWGLYRLHNIRSNKDPRGY